MSFPEQLQLHPDTHTMKRNIYILSLLLILLSSCEPWYDFYHRRPLEIYYDGEALVRLHPDWEHLGERPELMTVFVAKDGDSITDRFVTSRIDSFDMHLSAGDYKILIMNESMIDYQTMSFYNTQSIHDMAARANIREDIAYNAPNKHNAPTRTRENSYLMSPGIIGTAVDSFTITQEQLDTYRQFLPYKETATPDTFLLHLYDTIYDMTCRLNIYVRTNGCEYMRALAGSITGLADGFYLSRIWRTEEEGSLWLDEWEQQTATLSDLMQRDNRRRAPHSPYTIGEEGEQDSVKLSIDSVYHDDGIVHDWMVCHTSTFGLRHGKELLKDRLAEDNKLTLLFRLRNGDMWQYQYDVGKLIRYRNLPEDVFAGDFDQRLLLDHTLQLDLDIVINYPLPYPDLPEVPEGNLPSPFDVTVEPWQVGDSTTIRM